MKKGLFLIAAFGIVLFASVSNMDSVQSKKLAGTDKYKVIKVDGKIVFEQTKESMKKGDIFIIKTPGGGGYGNS